MSLPNVSGALLDWFQNMTFTRVTKIVKDFVLQEVQTNVCASGVRQPLSPQEVRMKPEGERTWKWEKIHALPTLVLNPDDIITFESTKYRIMSKLDWKEYGYVEYHMVEDYKS